MRVVFDESDDIPVGINQLERSWKKAIYKMLKEGEKVCYAPGVNIFLKGDKIKIYRWANDEDPRPPLVIRVEDMNPPEVKQP
jgi:hypothetical protein